MLCRKCKKSIDDDSCFCKYCGAKQDVKGYKRNANGTGSVFKDSTTNTYIAEVTLGYKDGKRIKRRKKGFKTKKEAFAYLPELKNKLASKNYTFAEIYKMTMDGHERSKQTTACYVSAFKYFDYISYIPFKDIGIDDLQECIDNCPKGKRTKQNMRVVASLMYKYAIPRGYAPQHLMTFEGKFLKINDEGKTKHRDGFNDLQLEVIRRNIGIVPYADWIYINCYLGFRATELLSLNVEDYDRVRGCIIGGIKTDAGRNRVVTVSPKIEPYLLNAIGNRASGALVLNDAGLPMLYNNFLDKFTDALEAMNINNPTDENGRRKYSPHSCRHTFATLMKRVTAPDKDKLELIGHTDSSMLMYYQDVRIDDLKQITDRL